MGENDKLNERGKVAQVTLVLSVMVFSLVLAIEDLLLDREKWMIPVVIVMAVFSVAIHVGRTFTDKSRIYIYTAFLMLELFYYGVNAYNIYDITPVIILLLVILAMSEEMKLLYICLVVGFSAIIYNMVIFGQETGFTFDAGHVFRTIFSLLLIPVSQVVVIRLMKTQQKQQEAYKERLEEVTEENLRANNFLANVSHEIRTPINAVIGLSTVSLKKKLDEEIRGNMESIKSAGHRVADQIGDILDYTEIDMSKLSVSEENYMISSVVNDIVNQTASIRTPDTEVIFDVDAKIPQMLVGDSTKIKKILWHLISNGVKFTKGGGVYVNIWALPREYGINLCLEVRDSGIGITEEEQERIFDKFYQSDSGRTRTAGGLGLGLSIVQGFVKAMGGFLSIESKSGSGTSVKVSIPQTIEDPSPCMNVENSDSLCLVGFFEFRQFSVPLVREFYQAMIRHLTRGLDVTMYMAANLEDVSRLISVYNVSHLLIGVGEYTANTDFMESLTGQLDVMVIANDDFEPAASSKVKVLRKPFYCFPIANMLNAAATKTKVKEEYARIYCPGVRALVVDDEPMNLIVANGIFKNYGMKVFTAASGQESIDKCLEEDFDLIFMDHMMPGMDGIEAMHRIRANAAKDGKEFGIIALTANAVSSAKEMFLSEGFDGFVPKPIELAELDRVLKRVLPKSMIVYEDPSKTAAGSDGEAAAESAASAGASESKEASAPESVPVTPADIPDPREDLLGALKAYGVDTAAGLNYCQNDTDFYKILLAQYGEDSPKKMEEMTRFYAEKDWPNYAIRVHGLKSTSKMIGANELSELAKTLEMAAKASDSSVIEHNHDKVMEMYKSLIAVVAEGLDLKLGSAAGSEDAAAGESGILEFSPDNPPGDEVLEFSPDGGSGEEVLEFSPESSKSQESGKEDVLEFLPDTSMNKGGDRV